MNVDLLNRVATKLKRMRHAKHFNMGKWAMRSDCGTAACIAGHGLLMSGYKTRPCDCGDSSCDMLGFISPDGDLVMARYAAQNLFGLNNDQVGRLFLSTQWPRQFRGAFVDDPKVAAARIQHFIDTNGQE